MPCQTKLEIGMLPHSFLDLLMAAPLWAFLSYWSTFYNKQSGTKQERQQEVQVRLEAIVHAMNSYSVFTVHKQHNGVLV